MLLAGQRSDVGRRRLLSLTFEIPDIHGLLLGGDVANYIRLVDRRQRAAAPADLGIAVDAPPCLDIRPEEIT